MQSRLPFWLTLLGAVPFALFAVIISFELTEHVDVVLEFMINYAAVIFAFLGGIHWGLAVSNSRERSNAATLMMVESIVAALLGWCILLLGERSSQLLAFAFLFAVIWGIDSLLYNNKIIPLWFFDLRGIVTPIVVVSMYVAYFSII